jgi:hypothetical protein
MVAAANLVEVAALVGDTARATMLNALMGGQSLTATELAYCVVRNLPDRDQQRRCANRSIMRPTTADSLGRAKRHLAHTLQAPSPLFDDSESAVVSAIPQSGAVADFMVV